nr:hypothetical protein [Tanacetum cinerariifolium]
MGSPAGHLSWVMGVVGMERGYYPGDFDGCCRVKGGERMYMVLAGKVVKRCTMLQILGTRISTIFNFTSLVPVVVHRDFLAQLRIYLLLISLLIRFGVDAAEELKKNMLSDCCSHAKLILLINAAKSN